MRIFWLVLLTYATGLQTLKAEQRIPVGTFSEGDMAGWVQETFVGETRYGLEEHAGKQVLVAHSDASASALYREIEVDLTKTPVLNWSWR